MAILMSLSLFMGQLSVLATAVIRLLYLLVVFYNQIVRVPSFDYCFHMGSPVLR